MYTIIVKKKAKKFLDSLPAQERNRITSAISALPNGEDIKPIQGHSDLLRLRVGSYRVIYTVDHGILTICVVAVGNRGDIYKHL